MNGTAPRRVVRTTRPPALARLIEADPHHAHGIDVSHHQGDVDWERVAGDGAAFAFVKRSEGTTWRDRTFAANWAGTAAAGLRRGAYHVFSITSAVDTQVTNFLRGVDFSRDCLPPVLDLEYAKLDPWRETPAALLRAIRRWLALVEERTGRRPILYAGHATVQRWFAGRAAPFRRHPLWVARYTTARDPRLPEKTWPRWTFWQFTETGRVGGVAGPVDVDRFRGDRAALARWARRR
jgi:lysozyme